MTRHKRSTAAPVARERFEALAADAARLVYAVEELLGVAEEIERRATRAEHHARRLAAPAELEADR